MSALVSDRDALFVTTFWRKTVRKTDRWCGQNSWITSSKLVKTDLYVLVSAAPVTITFICNSCNVCDTLLLDRTSTGSVVDTSCSNGGL